MREENLIINYVILSIRCSFPPLKNVVVDFFKFTRLILKDLMSLEEGFEFMPAIKLTFLIISDNF